MTGRIPLFHWLAENRALLDLAVADALIEAQRVAQVLSVHAVCSFGHAHFLPI